MAVRLNLGIRAVGLCLSLVLACAACGQPVADGFYLLSGDASASSVLTQDGSRLFLGRVLALSIETSDIYSEDNANSEFWVNVAYPNDPSLDATSLVLVVSDLGYRWAGSGSGPSGISSVAFRVAGEDNALNVSRFLNTPIVFRRHPGHQLLVSFSPTQDRFQLRDEVVVGLSITNIGSNTVTFTQGGRYRGSSRNNRYAFTARLLGAQVPDIGTNQHFGGIGGWRTLMSGEKFIDGISLSQWFSFDRAGRYEVHGSYYLEFVDPDDVPFRIIWTDYAAGDFVVTIED